VLPRIIAVIMVLLSRTLLQTLLLGMFGPYVFLVGYLSFVSYNLDSLLDVCKILYWVFCSCMFKNGDTASLIISFSLSSVCE
jgi:hypothetical protein